MSDKRIIIYSYRKVWNIEKKIYAFQNIRLPFPINPYELLEFIGVALLMVMLGKLLPFLSGIPTVLKYLAFPYVVTHYITKKKLDGKNPVKYLWGCCVYFFTLRNNYLQQLKRHPKKQTKITLSWNCSRGY